LEPENVDFEDSGSVNISVDAQGEGRLTQGTVLGGRYQIVGLLGHGAFGEVYRANDRQSGHPVAVRLVMPELLQGKQTLQRLKQELAIAGKLEHKNIAQTLDLKSEGDAVYIVSEHVDGSTVRDLIGKKQQAGSQGFTIKGAYNVVAHICNALAYAHQTTFHGALQVTNVIVNKAGRVKLTEFGLARALPTFARLRAARDAGDIAAMAPELGTAPETADGRADVYSVGAILFELLHGRPPSDRYVSEAGGAPELSRLIARCLSPNPRDRPKDASTLKAALHAIVERGATPVPVEEPRAPAARASIRPATPPHLSAPTPAVLAASSAPAMPRGRPSASGAIAVDENEEKWLINKGKLDFGPFSLTQVKEQILRDEILPEHIIIDNENGRREKVEENPLLHDLVMSATQRRDEKRRAHAEHHVVKAEKRKGFALYAMIGLGIVAIGLGGYYGVKKLRAADKKKVQDVQALESAELQVTIAFKPQPPRKAGGRKGGGSRPAGTKGGYDDSLDLGDASEDEDDSSERLDNATLNGIIGRHGNALGRCLSSSGERSASIEFIVAGASGKVTGVRVNGKTDGALANCIRSKMASMQFPTFNGPRTKGTFDMSI
jgi:serine/threonine protein kinase